MKAASSKLRHIEQSAGRIRLRRKQPAISKSRAGRLIVVRVMCALAGCWLLTADCHMAHAAVSKGGNSEIETSDFNQGGGTVASSKFRQQTTLGGAVAGGRLTSSRFSVAPGFIGAALSSPETAPSSDLDLTVLYAKTSPTGQTITPKLWQLCATPVFVWEPPDTGPLLAGYSYAIDGVPDDTVDTSSPLTTVFDVATRQEGKLVDGVHTFSVKAINTAGAAGKAITVELWVDATPPQVLSHTPAAQALLNTVNPAISAQVTDAHSGVESTKTELTINGTSVSVTFDAATGTLSARGAGLTNGDSNTLSLQVADVAGNVSRELVWSVSVDTLPPVLGRPGVSINSGATMTTSVYVTLGLNATDSADGSGIAYVLLSNEESSGYVQEPYVALRQRWKLNPIRGAQQVFAKFVDRAGNTSAIASDDIELALLSPDTVITSGPAGLTPVRTATFAFACPETECIFSYALDNGPWSEWSAAASVTQQELPYGNHYFRVKAAKDVNGTPGIQDDEEDPSPAERTWIVGVETLMLPVPKGPPIKVWRLE